MSKHAFSRIYERFVSLLEFEDPRSGQLSFLSPIPSEKRPEKTGAIYTPQFIAGFFTRYLRENMTPRALRTLRFIDPACGSGIFARTMLEMQCDPMSDRVSVGVIRRYFEQTYVIDKNENACEATRLSLSLLHLIATGVLPQKLKVICTNAIEMAVDGRLGFETYGAVVANPPYVKHEHLGDEERRIYEDYLSGTSVARVDSYLAFVKRCVALVSTGGFVCVVLPHAFLLADNAKTSSPRPSGLA
jgi:type I restriction-modification system DNA methylase subunit